MPPPTSDSPFSRRQFLQTAAGMVALAAVGCASDEHQEHPEKYPQVPENMVSLPKNGKSVLIVGAGLSGLISACELLDRGFKVTILEKNAAPGGRLRAWREKNFGQASKDPAWKGHPVEHGTHIVLSFYNNFREFLRRHGLTVRPGNINGAESGLMFAYPDATIRAFPISRAAAPFHTAALREGFARFLPDEAGQMGLRQALKSAAFDPANPAEVAYLDSVTVEEWATAIGAPSGFVRDFMDPLWDMGNFHPSSRTSALYFHRFFGSALGDWKDLFFTQFFRDSTHDSIIQPLKQYVVEHGGEIFFNQEVERFVSDGGRIGAVRTRAIAGQWICPICGEVHESRPGRCRRCSYDGTNFAPVFAAGREFRADHYLLAVDIPNARTLFSEEPFASRGFFAPVNKLPTSSIVVVYLWYPRVEGRAGVKCNWRDHFGERECFMTAGFPYLGTTLNLSLLKKESFEEFNADVIETQIARTEWTKGLSDWEIAANVHADLKALMPGLPDPQGNLVMRWDNFSTMTVGAESNRPSMFTPFENLLILGDWISLEQNCFLMEKVTVNAKRAVNHLLAQIGQAHGKLTILPSETPNLLVDAIRKTVSVRG